jgi:hypothetical protein
LCCLKQTSDSELCSLRQDSMGSKKVFSEYASRGFSFDEKERAKNRAEARRWTTSVRSSHLTHVDV